MELTCQSCHGCLNNVSKLTKADPEIVKCYRSILDAEKVDVSEISLCWECQTLMCKFIKFKRRVQYSYNVLLQMNQNDLTHTIKPFSSLYHQIILHNINYNPEQTPCEGFEVITNSNQYIIKTETIKEESDIDNEELFSEPIDKLDTNNIDCGIDKQKKNVNRVLAGNTDNIDCSIDKPKKNVKKVLAGTREKSKKVCNKKSIDKDKRIKTEKEVFDSKEVWFNEVHLNAKEVDDERSMLCRDSNYVNAMYKCESCIESFANSDDMKDHTDNKHNVNYTHKCLTCACTFSNPLSYTYHRNRHIVRFECARCGRRFGTKSKGVRHYEEHHAGGGGGFGCEPCQVEFSTEIELCMHKRTQEHTTAASLVTPPTPRQVAETHRCTLCDKSFKWRTSLNKHLDKHRIASGLKRRPFCEICSLTFTHSASLTKHVKTSWKHRMLLQERNAKEGHGIATASERERKFACALCDKRFQLKGNLQRHVASHAARAAGELVCVPCERTFSSIATFQQHMKISRKHVSEEDFQHKCTECEAKFVSKSKLRDHIDWEHLKNYTHSCDTCKKVFKSHTSLYLHTNTVHGKHGANHLCDHCGKSFPNVGKLRTHMTAVHTDGTPYKCRVCAATFSWHSCLSRHLKLVHKQTVAGSVQTSDTKAKK